MKLTEFLVESPKLNEIPKPGIKSQLKMEPHGREICHTNKNNLRGKNALYNSMKIIEIYKGEKNEFSQAVALNIAAGLIVSGKEFNFKDAYKKANEHLNSGDVFKFLNKIQSI